MSKVCVIKIGGSVLSLSENEMFNFGRAWELKEIMIPLIAEGYKFVLITGGGFIARRYQKILQERGYSDYDTHYVGTLICNMNAAILRGVFDDITFKNILALEDFDTKKELHWEHPVIVGGAGKPGPSSDMDAVIAAQMTGAKEIISLKDIKGVYSEDPKINKDAKLIQSISWDEYLNLIGNPEIHTPGGSFPVDPIAARKSKQEKIKFIITSGNNFQNISSVIKSENFEGTVIS
jgi:uridylate kinase